MPSQVIMSADFLPPPRHGTYRGEAMDALTGRSLFVPLIRKAGSDQCDRHKSSSVVLTNPNRPEPAPTLLTSNYLQ